MLYSVVAKSCLKQQVESHSYRVLSKFTINAFTYSTFTGIFNPVVVWLGYWTCNQQVVGPTGVLASEG